MDTIHALSCVQGYDCGPVSSFGRKMKETPAGQISPAKMEHKTHEGSQHNTDAGHGWCGLHRLASLRTANRTRPRSSLRGQLLHGYATKSGFSSRPSALRCDPPRHHLSALCRGGRDLQSRVSCVANPLSE